MQVEKTMIRKLIRAARADGMELDRVAFEGDWSDAQKVMSESEAIEAATACDMTVLTMADGDGRLTVLIVNGNGCDCLADYNATPRNDRIMQPVSEYAESLMA